MRYIRTKTFITELANWMEVDGKTLIIGGAEHKIIGQADTIEELCDEFVMVDEENEHYINQLNDIHHIRRKLAIGNYTVYGAIWTDKGLIYVAKMNEKGEMELL